jgi:hypothetical protein
LIPSAPALQVRFTAGKLIQFVRSTPGLLTVLVGQTKREHIESNIEVSGFFMGLRERICRFDGVMGHWDLLLLTGPVGRVMV